MPTRIDPALRERALRMVAEHHQDYRSVTAVPRAVGALAKWRKAGPVSGPPFGLLGRPLLILRPDPFTRTQVPAGLLASSAICGALAEEVPPLVQV